MRGAPKVVDVARAVAATPVADLVTKERRSSSLNDGVDIDRAELVRMPVLGAKAETLLDAARTRAAAEKSFMLLLYCCCCIM
jgi:hypothetical protein